MASESATLFRTPTANDPVLVEIVRRLVESHFPERIYLFGSTARGDAGPDSDYGLLILVAESLPARHRAAGRETAVGGGEIAQGLLGLAGSSLSKDPQSRGTHAAVRGS